MTFSIVGRDGAAYGVAVASKFLSVGAVVPAAWPGVGAIATQAWANVAYRSQAGALLADGHSAEDTLATLTASDQQSASRQAGVVSPAGAATFTGADCMTWAGGRADGDVTVQGNILTGPEVIDAMLAAWQRLRGERLAERLLAALQAGGDRRGRQSAALLVAAPGAGYGGHDIEVDLRVDDHTDPVPELTRLLELHRLYFDSVDEASLVPLEGPLAKEVSTLLAAAGHHGATVEAALDSWAGVENFEERLRPGRIDPLILERLRGAIS